MSAHIRFYARKDCCLCDEMKSVVREVAGDISLRVEEIDVDSTPELKEEFGGEVPVLFINGRKAFKYRVTAKELKKRLGREGF
ncbi:MAG: glutaredoxin family protein [Candidatus Binatia bacterium]